MNISVSRLFQNQVKRSNFKNEIGDSLNSSLVVPESSSVLCIVLFLVNIISL